MKILLVAPENAWCGFLPSIRMELPVHQFVASRRFAEDPLQGYDVLIPTMCPVTRETLAGSDRLRLIQQCGAGLEGVDLAVARELGIWVAKVPSDISGNADSVTEIAICLTIGLVDRNPLEGALAIGKIAGAGLDVFWEELHDPHDPQDPVFRCNVLVTPHISGSTDVSMSGVVRVVAENLRRMANHEEPLHLKSLDE